MYNINKEFLYINIELFLYDYKIYNSVFYTGYRKNILKVMYMHVCFLSSVCIEHYNHYRWWKLEEKLLAAASGSQPMVFKPTNELLNNHTNNTNSPITYVEGLHCFMCYSHVNSQ